jgi:hypothetical protein
MRLLDKLRRGVQVVEPEPASPPKPRRPVVESVAARHRREQSEGFAARQKEIDQQRTDAALRRSLTLEEKQQAAQREWAEERDRLVFEQTNAEQALAEAESGCFDLSSVAAARVSAQRLAARGAAEQLVERAKSRVQNHRNPNAIYRG